MNLLGEVHAGGRADPAHGERPALAEVDLVQVGLEDLRLRVAGLDEDGEPRLPTLRAIVRRGLSRRFFTSCWVIVLPPWVTRPAVTLAHSGAEQPAGIERAVLEEPMVLGGQHRVDDHLRRVGEANRPVFLARR